MEAIALAIAHPTDVLCPVIDARKGEVYWSLHRVVDGGVVEIEQPVASKPAMLRRSQGVPNSISTSSDKLKSPHCYFSIARQKSGRRSGVSRNPS